MFVPVLGNASGAGNVQVDAFRPHRHHRRAGVGRVSAQVDAVTVCLTFPFLGCGKVDCCSLSLVFDRMLVDNWSNKVARWVGRQEFVVSANVLNLVHGQTVVWTGALFCPLLPLINTAKFVILFYCKKVTYRIGVRSLSHQSVTCSDNN